MLDDAVGTAVLGQSDGRYLNPTIELKVSFSAPAPLGLPSGQGRIVHRGRSIAFLEGSLFAPDMNLLARAAASVRLVPVAKL